VGFFKDDLVGDPAPVFDQVAGIMTTLVFDLEIFRTGGPVHHKIKFMVYLIERQGRGRNVAPPRKSGNALGERQDFRCLPALFTASDGSKVTGWF
jgi:hypothetical protein